MTPWHKVPSEQQGWPVTVTWRVPLCRQQSHCPAAKSGPPGQQGRAALCTVGGAITRGSHTLSPPGDTVPAQQPLRPRPCWGPPSTRWVPDPVVPALPRVQRQRHRDPLVWVGTRGGSSCSAGISHRGFALLARSVWLRSVLSL